MSEASCERKERWFERLRQVWSEIVDLIYPPRCEICGADSASAFCDDCLAVIERIGEPFCRRCNVPLAVWEADMLLCRECRHSRSPLIAVRSAGLHLGTLRNAVLALKFDGALRLVQPLAQLLFEVVLQEADREGGLPVEEIDAIVPAVLHVSRRRWRGFDQAVALSKALSQMWGVPMVNALIRQRATAPQVELKPKDRKLNLRGAFVARPGVDVSGKVLVVVDDVLTTGATLEACAHALSKAGAKAVYGLTVSRTAPEWYTAIADPEAAIGL